MAELASSFTFCCSCLLIVFLASLVLMVKHRHQASVPYFPHNLNTPWSSGSPPGTSSWWGWFTFRYWLPSFLPAGNFPIIFCIPCWGSIRTHTWWHSISHFLTSASYFLPLVTQNETSSPFPSIVLLFPCLLSLYWPICLWSSSLFPSGIVDPKSLSGLALWSPSGWRSFEALLHNRTSWGFLPLYLHWIFLLDSVRFLPWSAWFSLQFACSPLSFGQPRCFPEAKWTPIFPSSDGTAQSPPAASFSAPTSSNIPPSICHFRLPGNKCWTMSYLSHRRCLRSCCLSWSCMCWNAQNTQQIFCGEFRSGLMISFEEAQWLGSAIFPSLCFPAKRPLFPQGPWHACKNLGFARIGETCYAQRFANLKITISFKYATQYD